MKRFLVFLAAVAMMAVSCNKEQPTDNPVQNDTPVQNNSPKMRHIVLRATIDAPGTKADYYNKKVQFAKGDEIAISGTANENGSIVTRRYKLTATGVENETTVLFEGDVPEDAEMGKFAYYPYAIIGEKSTLAGGFIDEENPDFIWPGIHYPFAGNVQVPMIGYINTSGSSKSATFYHLGAIAEITLENVPQDAGMIVFENNTPIQMYDENGQPNGSSEYIFTTYQAFMNADGTPAYIMPCTTNNYDNKCYVAINGNGTYYIPLPAGTYKDFSISLVDSYGYNPYFYKQRVSKPGTEVTLTRGMHANFGTLTYDADLIAEWYLLNRTNSWGSDGWHRFIKTGPNAYQLTAFNPSDDNSWKLLDGAENIWSVEGNQYAWNGVISQTSQNFIRTGADNKTFDIQLSYSDANWNYSSSNWGTNSEREWSASTPVQLSYGVSGSSAWTNEALYKSSYNASYIYNTTITVTASSTYNFKFVANGTWCGGNSVSISDSKPYAQAIWNGGDDMSFTLTPGKYDIWLDVANLNFMFVKQPKQAPLPPLN